MLNGNLTQVYQFCVGSSNKEFIFLFENKKAFMWHRLDGQIKLWTIRAGYAFHK